MLFSSLPQFASINFQKLIVMLFVSKMGCKTYNSNLSLASFSSISTNLANL